MKNMIEEPSIKPVISKLVQYLEGPLDWPARECITYILQWGTPRDRATGELTSESREKAMCRILETYVKFFGAPFGDCWEDAKQILAAREQQVAEFWDSKNSGKVERSGRE